MTEATVETKSTMFRKTTILYFSRGPILVLAVIISLLFPYIQEYITPNVIIHLAIGSLGIVWMLRDLSTILEDTTRSGLNLVLDSIVLDDILRAIYDPITGLYACCVGTYVGASSMYGLNMDENQRAELVQSSLGLKDENQAHSLLLEPGGCKTLFPEEIQDWLRPSQANKRNQTQCPNEPTTVIDPAWSRALESDKGGYDHDILDIDSESTFLSEESSSDSDEQRNASTHDDDDSLVNERMGQSSGNSKPQGTRFHGTERTNYPDPVSVFLRILQDMAKKKLKTCAEGLPRSKIESVGMASVVALGVQFALFRSSKKSRLLSQLCASVAALSFGTVLSREAILGNVYDKQTLKMFGRDLAIRILRTIKEKSASYKSILAMIVLIASGRMKQVTRGVHAKASFAQH